MIGIDNVKYIKIKYMKHNIHKYTYAFIYTKIKNLKMSR